MKIPLNGSNLSDAQRTCFNFLSNAFERFVSESDRPYLSFRELLHMTLPELYSAYYKVCLEKKFYPTCSNEFAAIGSSFPKSSVLSNILVRDFYTRFDSPSFSVSDNGVRELFSNLILYYHFFSQVVNLLRVTYPDAEIRITSGYRSISHNKEVGGVPTSNHVTGHAVDFTCSNDVPFVAFRTACDIVLSSFLRLGFFSYHEFIVYRDKNFIHFAF